MNNEHERATQPWPVFTWLGLRIRSAWLLAIALFFTLSSAHAQVIQLEGGSSTLFQASGASVEVHGPNYEGWVGAGSLDGQFRLGAYLSTQWHGATLGLGDNTIPFQFPTDIFDNSHYFSGRGASVAVKRERLSVYGFGGATSTGFIAPFFRGARAENGVGLLFLDFKLTPKLTAFSRNIISNRQTSISGLEWQPLTWTKAALSAGVGANQGYLASSLIADRHWISLKTSYVLAGNQFRRIVVQTPLSSETDRENILLTLRPKSFLELSAGRFNFLQPIGVTTRTLRATLNQYTASVRAAKFTLSGSLYQSQTQGTSAHGTSLSLGRDFAGRLQVTSYLYHSRSRRAPSTTSLVNMIHEVISPRISLLQDVTNTNGQTSVSFGGEFLSNPVSFGVTYQTVYSPFQTGNPFHQVLLLHVHLQLFGNVQVNAASYVAPDGSVKYTTYGSTLVDRGEAGPGTTPNFKLPKYMVSGRVLDEDGQPVAGAALRIGGDLVFSNSEGDFFVRKKKARPCQLELVLNQFLTPGFFDVVSLPKTVIPSPRERESPISIVLRRRTADHHSPS